MTRTRSTDGWSGQIGTLYSLGTVGSMPDDQLVELFLARDDAAASEAAFAALVDPPRSHGPERVPAGSAEPSRRSRRVSSDIPGSGTQSRNDPPPGVGRRLALRHRPSSRGQEPTWRRFAGAIDLKSWESRLPDLPLPCRGGDRETDPEPDFAPLIAEVDRLPERFRAPSSCTTSRGSALRPRRSGWAVPGAPCCRDWPGHAAGSRRGWSSKGCRRGPHPGRRDADPLDSARSGTGWLAQTTVQAASSLALAGAAIENVVSPAVATLSRGIARTLVVSKVRAGAGIILLAVAGVSIGLAATFPADEPRRTTPDRRWRAPLAVRSRRARSPGLRRRRRAIPSYSVAGSPTPMASRSPAPILLSVDKTAAIHEGDSRRVATSGPDGRFEVAIPRQALDRSERFGDDPPVLSAFVPGLGPDWVRVASPSASDELNIRLRRDDVPIEGRIIDLEGQPVSGADVHVFHLWDDPPDVLKRARSQRR